VMNKLEEFDGFAKELAAAVGGQRGAAQRCPALSIFAPLSPKGVRRPRAVFTTEEWVVRAPGSW